MQGVQTGGKAELTGKTPAMTSPTEGAALTKPIAAVDRMRKGVDRILMVFRKVGRVTKERGGKKVDD